ncbi:hypothetical protein [Lentzea sp. NBRC 102530]|uniref:hypothetical protein n=1 Tax=Lentzea sp. NBRC 102530 TaxID=3032201 RepID=UPI0024A3B7FD|nr:hypothetical protein [Lentzea sp. NBRC 102530]GLY48130.1 hypothetical protein Lesp01_17860 [Lentzea sp. NBRC 102530]
MKNALKIAIVSGIALTAVTACTSSPVPVQDAAPATRLPSVTLAPPTSAETTAVTNPAGVPLPEQPEQPEALVQVDERIGYGRLKLGMSVDEAVAVGLTGLNWGPNGNVTCTGAQNVAISKKYGIERITLPAGARTSRGIGVGSTVADVKRAYANAVPTRMGLAAQLNSVGGYQFSTYGNSDDDEIVEIKIIANRIDCANAAL